MSGGDDESSVTIYNNNDGGDAEDNNHDSESEPLASLIAEEEDEISKLNQVSQILKVWEDRQHCHNFNSAPILTRLSEIIECDTSEYLKMDPDPYDYRHLYRTHPDSSLATSLKTLLKHKPFLINLTCLYWREMSGGEQNLTVNTAACRLLVNALPGLENIPLFQGSTSMIQRLLYWAEFAPEPLQSYALCLLGRAMEISDIAVKFKEENCHLTQVMLRRLEQLQADYYNGSSAEDGDWEESGTLKESSDTYGSGSERPQKRCKLSTTRLEDCNSTNSRLIEMNGQWQVYPVNLLSRQIFTLRYLTQMGRYAAENYYAKEIILVYLSNELPDNEQSTRLLFEALKFLGTLLCNKRFAVKFVSSGGVGKLIEVKRPIISATAVSHCLYYMGCREDAMEEICSLPKEVLQDLISYTIWLLECSHNSGRIYALKFLNTIYPFKVMLELFDSQDGLRSVLDLVSSQPIYASVIRSVQQREPEDLGELDLSEYDQIRSKQVVKHVSITLRRYFECHFYFTVHKLKQKNGPVHPHNKAAKLPDFPEVHQLLLLDVPRMEPVERFADLFGIHVIMTTLASVYDWSCSGRTETVKNMLDILAMCCLVPRARLMLIGNALGVTNSSEHSGMRVVLTAAEGGIVNATEVKKSALQVIGNCVCGLVHNKKPSDAQIKLWESTRLSDGILILSRLLLAKTPVTDADSIRAMACWCLSGLARYEPVQQILQQLPLIQTGGIQELMAEPILRENQKYHVKFQTHALEIIKLTHGKDEHFSLELRDVIRKNDLITQGLVSYDEMQLLELINHHLVNAGFSETTKKLKDELAQKQELVHVTTSNSQITLDGIVKEYLLRQHARCKTPMVTCPKIDLFTPHKCPTKMDIVYKMQNSFPSRMLKQEIFGTGRTQEDRKLIYSKFKPCRVIRSSVLAENAIFASCAFSPCYKWTIAGMSTGDVKLFNDSTSNVEGIYTCHDSEIYHVESNTAGDLLLTSSYRGRPLSALWRMGRIFEKVLDFDQAEYVEFNKCGQQDKILATNLEDTSVYDMETKMRILNLCPGKSNGYTQNRATFDPFDKLILSDGVLWDCVSGKEIHKFDKMNENVNGVFNPKNGLEIISNIEILDTRTFHLLKTVRELDQCFPRFSNDSNILYAYKRAICRPEYGFQYRVGDSSFAVLDNCAHYSTIATIELKRQIFGLAVSPNDLQLAVIENHAFERSVGVPESCIRYYEIGRSNTDEVDLLAGLNDEAELRSDDEYEDDESFIDEDENSGGNDLNGVGPHGEDAVIDLSDDEGV